MSTEIVQVQDGTPENYEAPKANPRTGQNSLTLGLSLIAGAGATLMIVALGIGVLGTNVNQDSIGLMMLIGLGALIAGSAGWAGVTQPWANFDDINEPLYFGHHHDEHHAEDADTEETH